MDAVKKTVTEFTVETGSIPQDGQKARPSEQGIWECHDFRGGWNSQDNGSGCGEYSDDLNHFQRWVQWVCNVGGGDMCAVRVGIKEVKSPEFFDWDN